MMHNPGKPSPHGCEAQSVPGRKYTQGQTSAVGRKPTLDHGNDRSPHARCSQTDDGVKKAGCPEGSNGPHQEYANTEDKTANRNHGTGPKPVGQISGKGGQGYVGYEIGVIDRSATSPTKAQSPDHFWKDHAISKTNRIVDKEVDKAGGENNPGPVKGYFSFDDILPIYFHKPSNSKIG
ncbi:hypothetical protein ES703_98329 [subsurface metagenome]